MRFRAAAGLALVTALGAACSLADLEGSSADAGSDGTNTPDGTTLADAAGDVVTLVDATIADVSTSPIDAAVEDAPGDASLDVVDAAMDAGNDAAADTNAPDASDVSDGDAAVDATLMDAGFDAPADAPADAQSDAPTSDASATCASLLLDASTIFCENFDQSLATWATSVTGTNSVGASTLLSVSAPDSLRATVHPTIAGCNAAELSRFIDASAASPHVSYDVFVGLPDGGAASGSAISAGVSLQTRTTGGGNDCYYKLGFAFDHSNATIQQGVSSNNSRIDGGLSGWHHVDMKVNTTSAPPSITVLIDGVTVTSNYAPSTTCSTGAVTLEDLEVGVFCAPAGDAGELDIFIDNIVVSH